jgi:Spy/CpxP family protein refolding chaperone
MKTKMFLCVVLLAVTLLPYSGFADDKKGPREHPGKKMFAELGLTPEQEAKLKEIRAAAAPAKKLHQQQLEVVRQKIKVELQKEKPSKSALNKYAAEAGSLHKQMNLASIDRLLKIKAVLTPEQFNKLSERGFMHGPGGPGMDKARMTHKPRDGKDGRDGKGGKDGEKFRKPRGDGYGPEGAEFRKHRYKDKEGGVSGSVPAESEPPPATAPEHKADSGQ